MNLVITDYCMPGMTGYDLLKKIKVCFGFYCCLISLLAIIFSTFSLSFWLKIDSPFSKQRLMLRLSILKLCIHPIFAIAESCQLGLAFISCQKNKNKNKISIISWNIIPFCFSALHSKQIRFNI